MLGKASRRQNVLSVRDARSVWKAYPGTRAAVIKLIEAGWDVVKETKHYRAYCPCVADGLDFQIAGTPRNDSTWQSRIRDTATKCPDRHDLVQSRQRGPGVPPPQA